MIASLDASLPPPKKARLSLSLSSKIGRPVATGERFEHVDAVEVERSQLFQQVARSFSRRGKLVKQAVSGSMSM